MQARLVRIAMVLLALLLMGAGRLPSPCAGDGQGNPCAVAACACDASCSCTLACQAAQNDPHAACHMAAAMPGGSDAGHGHATLPKLWPPTLLATGWAFRPMTPEAHRPVIDVPASYQAPALALAPPPPRRTA